MSKHVICGHKSQSNLVVCANNLMCMGTSQLYPTSKRGYNVGKMSGSSYSPLPIEINVHTQLNRDKKLLTKNLIVLSIFKDIWLA